MENFGTIWIVCYVIQISLAIYMLVGLPRRGELGFWYERFRKVGILFGILPCLWLSVIVQVGVITAYLLKDRAIKRRDWAIRMSMHSGLGAKPLTSDSTRKNTDHEVNPFLVDRPPEPRRQMDEDNPFK